MKLVKLLLDSWRFCALALCLLLMWNEDSVTCSLFTAKLFETLFLITAIVGCKMSSELKTVS